MRSDDPYAGARLGALRGVTVVGPDLDVWAAAYRDHLDYRGGATTLVDEAQAQAWRCPAAAGCRTATLRPASGDATFIRFVESTVGQPVEPLAMLGWSAAEIVVQDLDAVATRIEESPFRVLAPPAVLDFEFTDRIRAMQVAGPAGEVLYLTEIDGVIPGFELPHAHSLVDRVFVGVLATFALERSAAWYAELAGAAASPPMAARVAAISDALGLDPETRYRLRTLALPHASLMELDEFPAASTKARPLAACGLPAGIAMLTFASDRHAVLNGPDGELVELVAEGAAS